MCGTEPPWDPQDPRHGVPGTGRGQPPKGPQCIVSEAFPLMGVSSLPCARNKEVAEDGVPSARQPAALGAPVSAAPPDLSKSGRAGTTRGGGEDGTGREKRPSEGEASRGSGEGALLRPLRHRPPPASLGREQPVPAAGWTESSPGEAGRGGEPGLRGDPPRCRAAPLGAPAASPRPAVPFAAPVTPISHRYFLPGRSQKIHLS